MNFKKIAQNKFEYRTPGHLLEVEIRDGMVHTQHGPENEMARAHQSSGGMIAIEKFMQEDIWQGEDQEIQNHIRQLIKKYKLH